jgi:hypothetical protein
VQGLTAYGEALQGSGRGRRNQWLSVEFLLPWADGNGRRCCRIIRCWPRGGVGRSHACLSPLTMRAVRWHRRYQQFACGWLLLLADNTVPSLAVIEQLSLLNASKLDASIEPTSDADTGVSVIVHGM